MANFGLKQWVKDVYHRNRYWLDPEFRRTSRFLAESEHWSRERLREYQLTQLQRLLKHAYQHVPYYHRLFDEYGIDVDKIRDFSDFKKIPFLTKEIVRANADALVADNIPPAKRRYVTTGGSTGTPLGLYIEKRTDSIRDAFEWRNWNWMGYQFGDPCVVLRGTVISNGWFRYCRGRNYLYLSTYKMSDELLPAYIAKIEEFAPKFIRGYPSAIELIATYLKKNNIRLKCGTGIKGISTTSEMLYDRQRKLFEEVLGCPVFDKYGNSEQVTIIGMCNRQRYHDFLEYTYTEFLDDNGIDVNPGEKGEIVGTAFTNYAMPFIRYRTGDEAIVSTKKCTCGREHTVIDNIVGRQQDYIFTIDGRKITLTSLIFAQHFQAFSRIKSMQLVQKQAGELIVRLVVDENYDINDEHELLTKIQNSTDNELNIVFKYVDNIERTIQGKQLLLVKE